MGGKAASYFPNEFNYLTIQTADQESQDLKSLFQRTSAFIESGVRAGGVLVHCFAGVSRSSTVVAAYLMDRHEMTAQDALRLVRRDVCGHVCVSCHTMYLDHHDLSRVAANLAAAYLEAI
jgi:protein-tyrosine phosphatase